MIENITQNNLQCLNPIVDEKTKIMIIGTMPGVASLQANEYYAYKYNVLWKIMAQIFNQGQEWKNYAEKIDCALQNKVGFWDNLHSCTRKGSLDSNIKSAEPNNFEELIKNYRQIKRFVCNGKKSYEYFRRFHQELSAKYECVCMPSTSPANATICYEQKLQQWKQALKI